MLEVEVDGGRCNFLCSTSTLDFVSSPYTYTSFLHLNPIRGLYGVEWAEGIHPFTNHFCAPRSGLPCFPWRKMQATEGSEAIGGMGRSDHATGSQPRFIGGLCGDEGRRMKGWGLRGVRLRLEVEVDDGRCDFHCSASASGLDSPAAPPCGAGGGKEEEKKEPAASYSRTGESRTTLGDGALDFRVRYGNGYGSSSMATGEKAGRVGD